MTCGICSVAVRWQVPNFLSRPMATVMFALSLTIYKIFAKHCSKLSKLICNIHL